MDGKLRRGRGGFLKGKLTWSLYRASATHKLPPPSSTAVLHLPYAAKAKPNLAAADHLSSGKPHQTHNNNNNNNNVNNIPAHHLSQLPTHARSVSYYPPTTDVANKTAVGSYSAANMDAAVYGGIAVDDEVDRKAANYISSVRERFRLDYLN